MPREDCESPSPEELRRRALSRWDNEGGASADGPTRATSSEADAAAPPLTNAELVQLRVRVIALENLVIALLAETSDRQLAHARAMAAHLSASKDGVHHPLTIYAASQMTDLIARAGPYRPAAASQSPPPATD